MTGKVKTNAYNKFIAKVEAGKLAARLHEFALAKKGEEKYDEVQMTNAQVTAARTLLGKVVPDMKSVEVKGQGEWDGDPNSISNAQLAELILEGREKEKRTLN